MVTDKNLNANELVDLGSHLAETGHGHSTVQINDHALVRRQARSILQSFTEQSPIIFRLCNMFQKTSQHILVVSTLHFEKVRQIFKVIVHRIVFRHFTNCKLRAPDEIRVMIASGNDNMIWVFTLSVPL